MSRGFFAGAGWGTVVAGLGLVVASQVTELDTDALKTAPVAVDAVAVEPTAKTGGGDAPAASVAGSVVLVPKAPQDAMPLRDAATANAEAKPTVPEGDVAPNQVAAPVTVTSETIGVDVVADAAASAPATSPEAKTTIDVPVTPELGSVPNAPSGTDPAANQSAMTVSDAPQASAADIAPEAGLSPEPALVEAKTETVPETGVAKAEVPPEGIDLQTAQPEKIDPVSPPVGNALPEAVEQELDIVVIAPPVTRPTPGFSGAEGVKTGRLPSIGAAPDASAEASEEAKADAPALPGTDLPPIVRYARKFENAAQKPLFAILLRDIGGPDVDREALAAIPFPVTFIIDPALPDAAIAAKIYRAAGQEVLMLGTGFPEGATASDLAVSLEAMGNILPEAVGIVDQETGGFQGNRALATQVLALVGDQGRGVISWDKGLNAASQVAQREGIRNAVIFRSMDAADEKSAVIRRYLDRAAFKAAQDGRVVVEGRTRPETVTALLEWAVEGRAATVAIAPATAVMTAQ